MEEQQTTEAYTRTVQLLEGVLKVVLVQQWCIPLIAVSAMLKGHALQPCLAYFCSTLLRRLASCLVAIFCRHHNVLIASKLLYICKMVLIHDCTLNDLLHLQLPAIKEACKQLGIPFIKLRRDKVEKMVSNADAHLMTCTSIGASHI